MVFYSLSEQSQFICLVSSSMVHAIDPHSDSALHTIVLTVIQKSMAYNIKKGLLVTFALFCQLIFHWLPMRKHEIIQIYCSHCHPWFIPVVSFLHYHKTSLLIQITWRTQWRRICQKLFTCKQLVALFRYWQWWRGTYHRRDNWWKTLTLRNLYVGSCYHRLQLQQPPQALMYLLTFRGNFSQLAFFF